MIKGFACGVFDLFHAGHVLMLQECKEHCDYLVVALNSANEIDTEINPGKQKPVFNLEHRKLILASCRFVDEVLVYHNESQLAEILENGNFQIRFLGEDYRNKSITAASAVAQIYYTSRNHGLSTSGYRKMVEERGSEN
jgi:glycerol-3-phosphate cytidylyltransferase